jgi:hypothetical protein
MYPRISFSIAPTKLTVEWKYRLRDPYHL